jgi:hypothetical protein
LKVIDNNQKLLAEVLRIVFCGESAYLANSRLDLLID